MTDAGPNTYDTVLYPGFALEQAHPDRLATLATLFGMVPADLTRCRILELGCGDGLHLIATALGLPEAECVGLDLAATGLHRGQDMVRALGLTNVTLRHMDLTEVGWEMGQFDFILAHGIYSWVPPEVRDKLLAICQQNLTANGVAYVSYNAYPGGHFRDLVRGMMCYHTSEFTDPTQRVEQARALLRFLIEAEQEPSLYQGILQHEWERISAFRDSSLYHDDLGAYNTPVYFYQFMEHAARHGLQYLAEANFVEMQTGRLPPQVVEVLNQMADSRVAREQYLDFLTCRHFRQTLLCHADRALDYHLQPAQMACFHIVLPVRPETASVDLKARDMATFVGRNNATLKTDQPLLKAAMLALSETWPQAMSFRTLLTTARAACDATQGEAGLAEDVQILSDMLLRAYAGGLIELHVYPPQFVMQPGERPLASPLARLQSREGTRVTTLHHHNMTIDDPLGRHFLQLLDGTRDRAALLDALTAFVVSGGADVATHDQPVNDPQAVRQHLAAGLEQKLAELARLALLVA